MGESTLMCLNIGTPKIIDFPFGTNGKLMVFGVPILKHFRAYQEFVDVFETSTCRVC